MSDQPESVAGDTVEPLNPIAANGDSLSARMRRRAHELETQITEVFPIPGWEDLIGVEMRSLSYQTQRHIEDRNVRVRETSTRELYTMADKLVTATEGLYELSGNEKRALDDTWQTLARRAFKSLPETLTPRQALLKIVGDDRLAYLFSEWLEWGRSVRPGIDQDVTRDFETTR